MSMLHTIQNAYVDLVVDVTGEIANKDMTQLLDGSTSGYTFDFSDKPTHGITLGPEDNASEVYFTCTDTSDDYDFGFQLFGYAQGGPAEKICDITGLFGTANLGDSTKALYADTLTVTSTHIRTVTTSDSGNNRIAKITWDNAGHKFLIGMFYDISGAGEALEGASGVVNAYIRFY